MTANARAQCEDPKLGPRRPGREHAKLFAVSFDGERALAWAQAERERDAVVRLGADLAAVGLSVLVFKGIHLAYAVAPSPDFRLCLDADVIVLGGPGSFERSSARIRALEHWKLHDENWSTHGATLVATGAYIDLHRMPLPPRFGRFDVGAAAARSMIRPDVFGPYVRVPDALDAAVLAVAHYVKDLLGAIGHGKIAADLELLVAHAGVEPRGLAVRLSSHGLRRVGLLAFTELAEQDPGRARDWARFRDACAASDVERETMSWLGRALVPLAARSERLGFLAVRGLADRPIDGAASMALAAARLARDLVFR